ncbi:B3/B4 domain-containing protein [Leifsonia sp. Le1]|uniref:B3/B4 domain-containing protein n=1 Tax=Leifsonia sp. Le1 TaxID=3404918 RepID=UPI003EBB0316
MRETSATEEFLAACTVDHAVHELRPDYQALLLVVSGLELEASHASTDALIERAESHARTLIASSPVDHLPHIAAWREAYRSFGAKPQRTRSSLEALTRRAEQGLPRVNALTDVYNAISVLHQIPLGGEDFDRYDGPAQLIRATGTETFDTVSDGQPVVEHPEPGEVVWADDAGVTCRRWNWRQGRRTALTDQTRTAVFILDALAPVTDRELAEAGVALLEALSAFGSDVRASHRLIVTP